MSIRMHFFAMLCLGLAVGESHAENDLRFAVLPDTGSATEIIDPKPLTAYLSERLDARLQRVSVASADALVAGLADGSIDFAWVDAYALLRLRRIDPASRALVQRPEDARSRSLIVTTRDDIQHLSDLRGQRFTFGSARSTSGWLMANTLLRQEGIEPATFFGTVSVAPYTDLALRWLTQGDSDAAVIDSQHWQRLQRTSRVAGRLRLIAQSELYADRSWSVRGGLNPAHAAALRSALLALDPQRPRDRIVLEALEAERYVAAPPEPDPAVVQAERLIGPLR